MDNVFQELDYSDISAKHMKGGNNRKFSEIDTKKRGGILKLSLSFIIFILVLVFFIILLVKSAKVNSLQDDIDKTNKEIQEKNTILKNIFEINILKEEIKLIQENINIIDSNNEDLKSNINTLENIIKDLNIELEYKEETKKEDLEKILISLNENIEELKHQKMKD